MSEFEGKRIAVIGMARTGVAAAKALKARGAIPFAVDEKPESDPAIAQAATELRALGIEVYPDWFGELHLESVDLIVPSPGVPRDHPLLVEAQAENIQILSEIEIAYRIAQCPIVAVTGTNGKSTTTAMIYAIARKGGINAWLCGNIAGIEGEMSLIEAASQAKADDLLVAEISSFQLEWVEQFKPTVGVLTVLQPDHLNRYNNDFSEYARTKARLFAAQTSADFAILNADDMQIERFIPPVQSKVCKFSLQTFAKEADAWLDNDTLWLRGADGEAVALMPRNELLLYGRHNVANALAASLAGQALDVPLESIRGALQAFKGLPHRMELAGILNGVRYLNNSMCTNPEAVAASVEGLEAPAVVIAGGVNKGLDFAPIGRVASKMRTLLLIGKDALQIEQAVRSSGYDKVETFGRLDDAVKRAREIASPGDVVMLAPGCASFDMFDNFQDRGNQFKLSVKALMEEAG